MTRTSTDIKHEIEELHEKMAARASYLGEQFAPNNVAHTVGEYLRENPREGFERAADWARQHPVAASLVGVAAASVLASATGKTPSTDDIRNAFETARTSGARASKHAREKAGQTASRLESKAQEQTQALNSRINDGLASARSAGKNAVKTGRDQLTGALDKGKSFAQENPVAAGAFAVAAGAFLAGIVASRATSSQAATVDQAPQKAKPKVSQAKRATRAKKTPNKVTSSMKPVKKTASKKAAKKSGVSASVAATASKTSVNQSATSSKL